MTISKWAMDAIWAWVLVAVVGFGCVNAPPVADAPAPTASVESAIPDAWVPDRIDLGFNLFDSGAGRVRKGGDAFIRERCEIYAKAKRPVDIEVYLDQRLHRRPDKDRKLMAERGASVRSVLESMGVPVREVRAMYGVSMRNGLSMGRRVEVILVKPTPPIRKTTSAQ